MEDDAYKVTNKEYKTQKKTNREKRLLTMLATCALGVWHWVAVVGSRSLSPVVTATT